MSEVQELNISAVRDSFMESLNVISTLQELDELRVRFTGKKGELTLMLRSLGKLPQEKRKEAGQELNTLRDEIESSLEQAGRRIRDAENERQEIAERIDVTLPAKGRKSGAFHPVLQTMHEIADIMQGLGYSVASGPEKEEEFYNFECLNVPSWHPARDMQDTFYFSDGTLLRTHTSPVQVRAMLKYGAPLRIVCPGKVYRRDNDTTHSPMFNQMEGLLIDKDVSFSVLKGTITEMVNAFFGRSLKSRFRASYFPFTEPSMELDIECVECSGHDEHCRVCHGTGWLEVAGMGMVHPNVIRAGKIDPEKYNGFAFGIGLDRMAMLKYGIADLRLLFDGNVSYFLSGLDDAKPPVTSSLLAAIHEGMRYLPQDKFSILDAVREVENMPQKEQYSTLKAIQEFTRQQHKNTFSILDAVREVENMPQKESSLQKMLDYFTQSQQNGDAE